jgi:hypothetical protein
VIIEHRFIRKVPKRRRVKRTQQTSESDNESEDEFDSDEFSESESPFDSSDLVHNPVETEAASSDSGEEPELEPEEPEEPVEPPTPVDSQVAEEHEAHGCLIIKISILLYLLLLNPFLYAKAKWRPEEYVSSITTKKQKQNKKKKQLKLKLNCSYHHSEGR